MKTIKVCWTEREVIEYSYEEDLEVEDDFVVDSEHLGDRICEEMDKDIVNFDNKHTNYEPIPYFQDPETGELKIKEFEIDSYEEILPPSPEDRKAEYLDFLKEIELKIEGMKLERERILKLVNE